MGKKKRRQQAGSGQPGYGAMSGMGAMGEMGGGGMGGMGGMAGDPYGTLTPGIGINGMGPGAMHGGLLHSLQGLVGSRHTEQFLLGALLGASAVFVLGDEELRAKLVKAAMKIYSGIAGGFEEVKEQMADIKAEVAAEQRSK